MSRICISIFLIEDVHGLGFVSINTETETIMYLYPLYTYYSLNKQQTS